MEKYLHEEYNFLRRCHPVPEEDVKMQQIMEMVAGLMAMAARTAPKAKGSDYLEIKILRGDTLQQLADAMVAYAEKFGSAKKFFARDGESVRRSAVVFLISLKDPEPAGLKCGACGYARCSELQEQEVPDSEFTGPLCAWRYVDIGIALGSAAKTASLHNADNRMMYTIGAVARAQKLIEGKFVVGIPLAATGKNIYFDRTF
jgi:uncharacterized ferredoxin-like protein